MNRREYQVNIAKIASQIEDFAMTKSESIGMWDASECVLLLIDYQDHGFEVIFEQDRRVIELNARTLANAARQFNIPIILTTVGAQLGFNGPTISSLRGVLPNLEEIDRSTMNAWEDAKVLAAVRAAGRKKLVMAGIVTSVSLTYTAVSARMAGHDVAFIADAMADSYQELHDIALLRLAQTGAVPNTTIGMIAEWFRDWKSPLATSARQLLVPYYSEIASLKRAPEFQHPEGLAVKNQT